MQPNRRRRSRLSIPNQRATDTELVLVIQQARSSPLDAFTVDEQSVRAADVDGEMTRASRIEDDLKMTTRDEFVRELDRARRVATDHDGLCPETELPSGFGL
jgi:hypothetical protein